MSVRGENLKNLKMTVTSHSKSNQRVYMQQIYKISIINDKNKLIEMINNRAVSKILSD